MNINEILKGSSQHSGGACNITAHNSLCEEMTPKYTTDYINDLPADTKFKFIRAITILSFSHCDKRSYVLTSVLNG